MEIGAPKDESERLTEDEEWRGNWKNQMVNVSRRKNLNRHPNASLSEIVWGPFIANRYLITRSQQCLLSSSFWKTLHLIWKLHNCTLFSSNIFLTSGSDIFNFRFTKNCQSSGYEVPIGSRKVPHAIARVELYIPPKFHANRSTRLGEESMWHINASHLRLDLGLIETIKINKSNELHLTRIF